MLLTIPLTKTQYLCLALESNSQDTHKSIPDRLIQSQLSDNVIKGPKDAYKLLVFLKQKANIFNAPIRNKTQDSDMGTVYLSSLRMILHSKDEYHEILSKIEQQLIKTKWQKHGSTWTNKKAPYLVLTVSPMVYAEGGVKLGLDVIGKPTEPPQIRVRQVNIPEEREKSIVVKLKPRVKLNLPKDFMVLPFTEKN